MAITKEKAEIYQALLDQYGRDAQLNMAVEELGELIVTLQHTRRLKEWGKIASVDQVADEVADVELMCEQLRYMFDLDSVKIFQIKEEKLKVVKDLLKL